MPNHRAFKTEALVEVNHHILDAALDSISDEPEWEFFCECGRPTCLEHVSLTIDAFVALQADHGAVLARGHSLTRDQRILRAEHARRAAQRLREEARALGAQADMQKKRAKKLRAPTTDA